MSDVPRETREKLDHLVAAVKAEPDNQNLVARSTFDDFHDRHIADSLQLLALAPANATRWIDIGSGAGFPGLVIAIAAPRISTLLVEPRARRAAFLQRMVDELDLANHTQVIAGKIEHVTAHADVISARAVAKLTDLFAMSLHLAGAETHWLLPKGRTAAQEVEEARQRWAGSIKLVPSVTSADAAIVVAQRLRRKEQRA